MTTLKPVTMWALVLVRGGKTARIEMVHPIFARTKAESIIWAESYYCQEWDHLFRYGYRVVKVRVEVVQ